MSLKYITPAAVFKRYLPKDYVELIDYGPFGKTQDEAGPGNMGQFKELLEEQSSNTFGSIELNIRDTLFPIEPDLSMITIV